MKVFIVGSYGGCEYAKMFEANGWDIAETFGEADLIQFTGGSDVTPSFYDEEAHPSTMSSLERDEEEQEMYDSALALGIPMTGICRGGQFLNVMNGGRMWQDVNNHAIWGTHEAVDEASGKTVNVTSTHHQMMYPCDKAIIAATAHLSTAKDMMVGEDIVTVTDNDVDVEACFYEDTRCLCFQPHPEFKNVEDCTAYYFELLNRFF